MKTFAACVKVLAVALLALVPALLLRALVPLLAKRWRWVERVGDWLWERRFERKKRRNRK